MTSQINIPAIKELESIEKRLDDLEHERKNLVERRDVLGQYLSSQQDRPASAEVNLSVNEKVKIFNGLFKGRSDVYAVRWQNSKGRSGYSVACHNEWVQGLCQKPKIKCGDCTNRNYKSIDEQVIYEHLTGKLVVGLYPLLKDKALGVKSLLIVNRNNYIYVSLKMKSMISKDTCAFCTLDPKRVIYENNTFWVVRDDYPVSQGHTLLIPKEHIASVFNLDVSEFTDLRTALQWAKSDFENQYSPDSYNIGINDGSAAGQTVTHLHVHLIPRYKGDHTNPHGGVRWILPEKAKYWVD